jgi:hypothetical protein
MKHNTISLLLILLALSVIAGKGSKKYNNIMEITKDWDGKRPKKSQTAPPGSTEYIPGMEINPADIIDFRAKLVEEKGSAVGRAG